MQPAAAFPLAACCRGEPVWPPTSVGVLQIAFFLRRNRKPRAEQGEHLNSPRMAWSGSRLPPRKRQQATRTPKGLRPGPEISGFHPIDSGRIMSEARRKTIFESCSCPAHLPKATRAPVAPAMPAGVKKVARSAARRFPERELSETERFHLVIPICSRAVRIGENERFP